MEAAAYDLIVVGAGPAGCACAITAARAGASVLLLEKDRFPRHKVCGEFVSPESLHLLSSLVGEKCFSSSPEIAVSRIFTGKEKVEVPVSPAARSIPRFELDDALLRAARNTGVDTREQCTVTEVRHNGDFQAVTQEGEFRSRTAVNGTGRWSRLTQPAAPANHAKWIGLKGHFREASPSRSVDLYFFPGGYCGVQPVADEAVNACAMVRADAARSLTEVLSLHPALAARSKSWEPLFPPISTSGLIFRAPQTHEDGMLMAGDAAAFIDPFVGDGISLALQSGNLAAECLLDAMQGRTSLDEALQQYEVAYRRRFSPAFRNAALIRRLVGAPHWISSRLIRLAAWRPVGEMVVRATRART